MKQLSDTLEAMKLETGTQKELSLGSTQSGGALTIQRQQPLTESQLTEIALQTLQGPLLITSKKETIYGRNEIFDGSDRYWVDNEPIGTEQRTEVSIRLKHDCPAPMINAALALSPKTACLKHLTHLAIHKKMGTSDADRTILLSDYVHALSGFPEFVLYIVCKHYWERDRRPFLPFIDEMKEACEAVQSAFERKKPCIMVEHKEKEPQNLYFDDPKDNPVRRILCDFLVERGHEDYFEKTRFFSNYQLELLAKTLGFGKQDDAVYSSGA